jgi:hypothetical protein
MDDRSTGDVVSVPESERPAVRAAIADILRSPTHPDGGYMLIQNVRYSCGINAES